MSANYPDPVRRPLKIFAYDPMLGRMPLHRITVEVLNERLRPGPWGSRVQVLDYDGVTGDYYEPADLNDPAVLMQGGLEPTESDPRFHQLMVYAVAMKTIENFEIALGRKFHFRGRRPLKIFPHAFRGPTPSSRRGATPCSSATSWPTTSDPATTRQGSLSSRACLTTSWRTR